MNTGKQGKNKTTLKKKGGYYAEIDVIEIMFSCIVHSSNRGMSNIRIKS